MLPEPKSIDDALFKYTGDDTSGITQWPLNLHMYSLKSGELYAVSKWLIINKKEKELADLGVWNPIAPLFLPKVKMNHKTTVACPLDINKEHDPLDLLNLMYFKKVDTKLVIHAEQVNVLEFLFANKNLVFTKGNIVGRIGFSSTVDITKQLGALLNISNVLELFVEKKDNFYFYKFCLSYVPKNITILVTANMEQVIGSLI